MIRGLRPAERAVADCAQFGRQCRLDRVGTDRPSVRPAVVEALLRGGLEADGERWLTHPRGVVLSGAAVDGDVALAFFDDLRPLLLDDCSLGWLDLTAATVPRVLLFGCDFAGVVADAARVTVRLAVESCEVRGLIAVTDAVVGELSLCGTHIAFQDTFRAAETRGNSGASVHDHALDARRLRVDGAVLLNRDEHTDRVFTADGPVNLVDASIGHFGSREAVLAGIDSYGSSLVAERLTVSGSVHLAEGLTTAGAVRLVGARIGNQLSVRARRIGPNRAGEALVADGIDVGGRVDFVDYGPEPGDGRPPDTAPTVYTEILGRVALTDARMRGLRLTGVRILLADGDGDAVVADRVKVNGDVEVGPFATVTGAVRLDGAQIDGTVVCRGVALGKNDQAESFSGDHMTVSGHVHLEPGFVATGAIRLLSAHVKGQLRCTSVKVSGPNNHGSALFADDLQCDGPIEISGRDNDRFEICGGVQLSRARFGGLHISHGSIVGSGDDPGTLSVAGAVVNGSVRVTDEVVVAGVLLMNGADVRGQLDVHGARFDGQDERGNSIVAEAVSVKGDAVFAADQGVCLTTAGAVRLRGAVVGGDLSLLGVSVAGADAEGYAIFASYMNVTGRFVAAGAHGHDLVVAGAIRLADSRLGGLHVSGGRVGGRRDDRGYALAAHAVQVASQVTLGPALTLDGAVSLFGASMNQLRCQDMRVVAGSRAAAMVLDNATIRGNLECEGKVVSEGAVKIFGATVGGNIVLDGLEIDGRLTAGLGEADLSLAADSLQVAGDLSLLGLRTAGRVSLRSAGVGGTLHIAYDSIGGRLSLASARVAVLRDDPAVRTTSPTGGGRRSAGGPARSWRRRPTSRVPEIDLVGLRYDHLSRKSERPVRHRLAWLSMLPGHRFHSQPHEHLASVYRSQGDDGSARLVAIDKHQRRLRDQPRWRFRRLPRWILYVTVGHGYRPWLAGCWALLVISGFAALVDHAENERVMIQNRPLFAATQSATLTDESPTPEAAVQSGVDLHECDDRWQCLHAIGYAADTFFPGVSLGQDTAWRPDTNSTAGGWLRYVQWAVAASGWFLATIFLAAVAGVVRQQ